MRLCERANSRAGCGQKLFRLWFGCVLNPQRICRAQFVRPSHVARQADLRLFVRRCAWLCAHRLCIGETGCPFDLSLLVVGFASWLAVVAAVVFAESVQYSVARAAF